MEINFRQINNNIIDLSKIESFMDYYNDSKTYLPLIIKMFNDGCYDYLKDRKLDVVLDLGANIGLFSLFIAPQAKEIFVVEPDPYHFQMCKKVLKGIDNIHFLNKAIGNENKKISFFRSSWNSTCNTIIENNLGIAETIEVDMIKTNEITDKEIDFVKMDIEGAEQLAFNDPTFPFEKIKEIEISIHPVYGANKEMILSTLNQYNFKYTIIEDPNSPIVLGRKI